MAQAQGTSNHMPCPVSSSLTTVPHNLRVSSPLRWTPRSLSLLARFALSTRLPTMPLVAFFSHCFPHNTWPYISLNFVTGLPPSDGNTTSLTIVDRFSKSAQFVPLPKLPSAKETAELLLNHVFLLFEQEREASIPSVQVFIRSRTSGFFVLIVTPMLFVVS